jgi:hypothetical protein
MNKAFNWKALNLGAVTLACLTDDVKFIEGAAQ